MSGAGVSSADTVKGAAALANGTAACDALEVVLQHARSEGGIAHLSALLLPLHKLCEEYLALAKQALPPPPRANPTFCKFIDDACKCDFLSSSKSDESTEYTAQLIQGVKLSTGNVLVLVSDG
jgi:hypothetical protein